MRLAPAWVLMPLLLVGFAGCSGQIPAPAEAEGPQPLAFDDETGAIDGLVLDEEGRPVVNLTAFLHELKLERTTDSQGGFSFSSLTPAAFTVSVSGLGYVGVARRVDVEAGRATTVVLVVSTLASEDPHTKLLEFDGHWSCTIVLAVYLQHCGEVFQQAYVAGWSGYALEPHHTSHLIELTWKASSAYTQPGQVQIRYHTKNNSDAAFYNHGLYKGGNPVRFQLRPGEMVSGGVHGLPEDANVGAVTTYPMPIVNAANYGVGPIIQQRFKLYITTFHYQEMPEGFSSVPDS